MESVLPLIVNLVSGAIGGNIAGGLLKNFSLGILGNSIVGVIGGGALLGAVGSDMGVGVTDIADILYSVASGGVSGGVLVAIIGVLKNTFTE